MARKNKLIAFVFIYPCMRKMVKLDLSPNVKKQIHHSFKNEESVAVLSVDIAIGMVGK